MPPSFRKVSFKLNNFSRSNRHVWLSRTVVEECQVHSWKSLCCLKYHRIVMDFFSPHGKGILSRSFLTLSEIADEGRWAMSAGDGCMSQDQRQRPCWGQRTEHSTTLATKRNRKESEPQHEDQGRPTSGTMAASCFMYPAAIPLKLLL